MPLFSCGRAAFGFNDKSNCKQEAMNFYEYLLSEPVLVEYYENGYGIPVYPGIAEKALRSLAVRASRALPPLKTTAYIRMSLPLFSKARATALSSTTL